jgi:CRP-like cAMP-binding protein
MDKIALLKTIPIFSNLSRAHLIKIAQQAEEVKIGAGKVILREGKSGSEFYYIIEGEARIENDGKVKGILKQNSFFGEISLIDGKPRLATVVANTDMKLLVVESQYFPRMIEKTPTLANALIIALCQRIRERYDQLSDPPMEQVR